MDEKAGGTKKKKQPLQAVLGKNKGKKKERKTEEGPD